MRLSGRKALVTGAASGIGAATARRLAADGAEVVTIDCAGAVDTIADLATPEGIAATIAAAGDGLDVLVNNAGVCPVAPLDEADDAGWERAFAVNVTAAFRLTRALAPHLRASPHGRVLNTGSILSSYGNAGLIAYSASKHAILGLTRALAGELGPAGVTVNCVQPGAIVTGMTRPMFDSNPESAAYYIGRSALGRLGRPEDIADVFAFLASDDARFITGQGIMVDGGVMAHS